MKATPFVLLAVLCGCSFPSNPHTRFGYGPVQFFDSKDNDVEVDDLVVAPQSGEYRVKKLTIRNNASDVRRANVEQIQAYTEQVKAVSSMVSDLGNVDSPGSRIKLRIVHEAAAPKPDATQPSTQSKPSGGLGG